jgi:hypothetical protein
MNRAETLRIMTLLAQLTGPAPEGDAWDLTANAWAAVLADISEADMLRAVKSYVTGGPDRAPGTWWPKPGELLGLLRPAELTNEAAFALLSPILHRSIPADEVARLGLTPTQQCALAGLPDTFTRARMSIGEIHALRRQFLAGCQAAEVRAKAGTTATVRPFPRLVSDQEPRRIPVQDMPSAEIVARLRELAAKGAPHGPGNGPRGATEAGAHVRGTTGPSSALEGKTRALSEEELRERNREKVARVRARFGGGR